jgi:quercetin dioxygenase-like cupin family protein
MYKIGNNEGYRQALEGITQKTLVYGEQTLMAEFRLAQGAQLPLHSHPHEQTGYLVRGRLKLTIGSDSHDVMPGDSWCIPGGVGHCAEAREDSVAVEVFAPVREDYLP